MAHTSAFRVACIAALLTQPAFADERKIETVKTYERRVTDNWIVQGLAYPNHERGDVCLAWKEWKDGSRIEFVKDLKDGEFYIWHQTMGWNRINDDKTRSYTIRVNFHDQQGTVIDGGTADYRLINKNTILLRKIEEKRFLKAFVNANRIVFIPDGNVSNTQAYFDGKANDIATVLADCVQMSGKAQGPATAGRNALIEPPSLDLPAKVNVRNSL